MDGSKAVEIRDHLTGDLLRKPVFAIGAAATLLDISRNMMNRYLNNRGGFHSKIFGCRVTVNVQGFPLLVKTVVHRLRNK